MQAVTGWSGLITEGQLQVAFGELRHEPLHHIRRTVDIADEAHLAVAPRLGHCHRYLQLRCVQSDVDLAILPHGSFPLCERLGVGPPDATLVHRILRTSHLSDNEHTVCQIGVFASYVSRHGHGFIDRALYLPKTWTDDPKRLKATYVPSTVDFATKPQLAATMIARAIATAVPFRWVAGDTVYGVGDIERDLRRAGKGYVLGVDASHVFRSWGKPRAI